MADPCRMAVVGPTAPPVLPCGSRHSRVRCCKLRGTCEESGVLGLGIYRLSQHLFFLLNRGELHSCKAVPSGVLFGTALFVLLCSFKVNPLIQCDPFKKSKHYMLQEGNKALSRINHVLRWSRGGVCVALNSSIFSRTSLL